MVLSVPLMTVGVTKFAMMIKVIIAIILMFTGVFPRFGTFLDLSKWSVLYVLYSFSFFNRKVRSALT